MQKYGKYLTSFTTKRGLYIPEIEQNIVKNFCGKNHTQHEIWKT